MLKVSQNAIYLGNAIKNNCLFCYKQLNKNFGYLRIIWKKK